MNHNSKNDTDAESDTINAPYMPEELIPLDNMPSMSIAKAVDHVQMILNKSYLQNLSSSPIVPYNEEYPEEKKRSIRWYRIDRIVYEQGVFFTDKFSMLLNALHGEARELVLLLHKNNGERIQLFLGASDKNTDKNFYAGETLKASLEGIFPGIQIERKSPNELIRFDQKAVSAISAAGSLRGDRKEGFVQGLERLINASANIPSFTGIMIAEHISEIERLSLVHGYEQIHTMLSPLASIQLSMNRETSETLSEGESKAISRTLTQGVSRTISHSSSYSETLTSTTGENTSEGITKTIGANIGLSFIIQAGGSYSYSKHKHIGKNSSQSKSNQTSTGRSEADGTHEDISDSTTDETSKGRSRTQGEGMSVTYRQENKTATQLLAKIDKQIEELDSYAAMGFWNCATYFITPENTTSRELANIYKGCIIGEGSNHKTTAINIWNKERKQDVKDITAYLANFVHPRFFVGEEWAKQNVSAGLFVNSQDLAIHMALPQSSVPGVQVKIRAAFGREVIAQDNKNDRESIHLGKIYHLGQLEENTHVQLHTNSLTKHIFVTGSTGSGKSNTLYVLLKELIRQGKKVLIIEPAKGEYKHVFKDAMLYGTNPDLSKLLRMNPFCFPDGIRIDEHIDRLVEIFNVCWPMYAAMPAVLKDAVIRSYEACGWNMITSQPLYKGLYPTFTDVLQELRTVIRSSEYSADTQGDYIGALETRLRSLTNGINEKIFCSSDTISDKNLFDQNVIVDLSRIGSNETRSLIMGMLMLKLSEYRMTQANGKMNQPLQHVTVLEEAHNLLKRVSKEQTQEGSNLQGKSVEMIANAIAEMRTYGEGFILADQSPTALDDAAIKNTNTKIIMSLPDGDDRRIAGKSVGLTDEQIDEISNMPVGVGIVYQNNWSEAVMCKIDEYEMEDNVSRPTEPHNFLEELKLSAPLVNLLLLRQEKYNTNELRIAIKAASIRTTLKKDLLELVDNYEKDGLAGVKACALDEYRAELIYTYCSRQFGFTEAAQRYQNNVGLLIEHYKQVAKQVFDNTVPDVNLLVGFMSLVEKNSNPTIDSLWQEWCKSNKIER